MAQSLTQFVDASMERLRYNAETRLDDYLHNAGFLVAIGHIVDDVVISSRRGLKNLIEDLRPFSKKIS